MENFSYTITYNAKCKDCKFIERYQAGKLIRHKCTNEKSSHYNTNVRLKDLVCDSWKL